MQLLDFVDDINKILNDQETGGGSDGGGHGLMLTIHMLRRHRSVHMIHRHLVTRYDDLCRDYSCLDSLHSKMQQQIDKVGPHTQALIHGYRTNPIPCICFIAGWQSTQVTAK